MNLVLDIGNTRAKASVYSSQTLVHSQISENDAQSVGIMVSTVVSSFPTSDAIVSSVSRPIGDYLQAMPKMPGTTIALSHQTPVPIGNHYATPHTLGLDRLAAAVGASVIYPESNVLIIDAGTAITYDVLDINHNFVGGNIAPGIAMRLKALHHFTHRLPLVEQDPNYPDITQWGRDTRQAIHNGVMMGVVHEIDGYITDFLQKNVNTKIILTGGDSIYLSMKLKNTIFAEPNLVSVGLNRILNYNVRKND